MSTSPGSPAATGSSSAPGPSASPSTAISAPTIPPSTAISAPTIEPGELPPITGAPVAPRPGAVGASTELSGTVEAGVESGCVVLTDARGAVLANLIGLDTAGTPLGSEVVVTGTFQQGMMTTCQQGAPFQVTSVRQR